MLLELNCYITKVFNNILHLCGFQDIHVPPHKYEVRDLNVLLYTNTSEMYAIYTYIVTWSKMRNNGDNLNSNYTKTSQHLFCIEKPIHSLMKK